jgi:release factor glutamine methyltransferase
MKLADAYARTVDILREAGIENYTSNARLLLMDLTGVDEQVFFTREDGPEVPTENEEVLWKKVERRAQGEPIELVLGWTYFFDNRFYVESGVFNPRPDTEVLVEQALKFLKTIDGDRPLACVDLCCGSGVVGLSLAISDMRLRFALTDVSPQAVALTGRNIEYHELTERVTVEQSDLFPQNAGRADLIVSNPPYISREEGLNLPSEVVDYDPPSALYGGEDGLDVHRRVLEGLSDRLKSGGALLMEIGWKQGESSRALFENAGLKDVHVYEDYAGHTRIVAGVMP